MPWIDAFIPHEQAYRAAVMKETWGHLAPQKNRTYRGRVVLAVGCFGSDPLNPTIIACDFGDLDSSPWFSEAVTELVDQKRGDEESGRVYEWLGTFRNYQFFGKFRLLFDAAVAKEQEEGNGQESR